MLAEELFQKYSDQIEVKTWWYEFSMKEYFPANLKVTFPSQMLEDYRNIHKFEGSFPDGKKFLEDTNFIDNIKNSARHQQKLGPQELTILDYIDPEMSVKWVKHHKSIILSVEEE